MNPDPEEPFDIGHWQEKSDENLKNHPGDGDADFQHFLMNSTQELIEEVAFQIEKDFGMAGFAFENRPYLRLEDLLPELILGIDRIRTERSHLWMKIIFRVDLTEKQYKFAKGLHGEPAENLAKAVVLRELQKVYTRKKLSQKEE